MCSYIGVKVSKLEFIKLKQLEKKIGVIATLKTLQSGFEYADWAIIKANQAKTDIEIELAHWEFIPTWVKTETALNAARKQGIPWLNATAEKLLSSKMFSNAARQGRCLIPISHFYEWRHFKHVGGKKPVTYPYIISVKNVEVFYVAGIYQPYINSETGELKNGFAIITTAANELMAQIHNTKKRMPTILPEDLAHAWLFNTLNEKEIFEIASFKIPTTTMQAYTISKNFRNLDNPIAAFLYEDLLPLF